jgi:anaerobic magnesium-protoporphyrin IX monomethyl ester cyclase
MRTLLVYPPLRDPTRPHQAIPLLAAVLNVSGAGPAHIDDANIRFWNECLSAEGMRTAVQAVEGRLEANISEAERDRLKATAALGTQLAGRIDAATRTLRERSTFLDEKKYAAAIKVIRLALSVISARWAPSHIDFIEFNSRFSAASRRGIEEAVAAREENPFIEFFRRTTIPRVAADRIGLVKISLTYPGQMIPALTLAHWVKQDLPEVHVALGGSLVCLLDERLRRWEWLFRQIDSYIIDRPVPYDSEYGETGLVGLARALDTGCGLARVPGLVYVDTASRTVIANPCRPLADLSVLPAPDYDEIPWSDYLSPERICSLAFSRGCTWSRCTFCGHTGDHRARAVENAVHDLRLLHERHSVSFFYFCDDEAAPADVKALAAALAGTLPDCRWHWMIRPGHGFGADDFHDLFRAGCRSVFMGLESASPRILELLENGAGVDLMGRYLKQAAEAGIGVRSFSIVGFPTEEAADAGQTYSFLRQHRSYLRLARIQPFCLVPGSRMHREARRFGIVRVPPPADDDLNQNLDFQAASGMSRAEAAALAVRYQQELFSDSWGGQEQAPYLFPLLSGHGLLKLAEA